MRWGVGGGGGGGGGGGEHQLIRGPFHAVCK